MALKVLIIDPDEEWLYSAKDYLTEIFYEVDVVSNGKDAQLSLYNNKYFAVILNLETQNHSGAQVLRFLKTNHPSQKVVMVMEKEPSAEEVAADESLVTKDSLLKQGATEVLAKPFEFSELRGTLEGHQSIGDMMTSIPKRKGVSAEEEVQSSDENFTKVRIDEFYTSQPVIFDLFIRLNSGRYVKILHSGDSMPQERIDKYKNDKKVEFLFFEKKDLAKYVKFHNHLATKIMGNQKVQSKTKVKLLQNVSAKYLEEAFTEGLKPQIIDQGKEVAANVAELVENQPDLYKLLRSYQDFDPNAFTHAYLVTLFSTSIIKQFEWQSRTTIETTALACLLHDIGKLKLPKSLLEKSAADMDEEELALYHKHPEMGVELMEGNRLVTNSVRQIVLQHHEHYDGTGFPHGAKTKKILTLANIVCLSNDFVHIILDNDIKPVEALKILMTERRDWMPRYNSIIVECLMKVFVDPEKIVKESILPSNSRIVNKKAS